MTAKLAPDDLLMQLLAVREEYVAGALERPKGKEAFDYGEAVGIYKGLSIAIELCNGKLEDADKANQELEKR